MMRALWVVAENTFLEGIRARFFVGVLLVCAAFVTVAAIVAHVPYGEPEALIGTIGWGAIFLSGCALSVFYVISTVARERDTRVLNLILARPISRSAYVLGKMLGFYLLATAAVLVESTILYLLMALFAENSLASPANWAIGSLYVTLKVGALLGYAVLFGHLFVTPIVAMISTATVFLIGVGAGDVVEWAEYTNRSGLLAIGKILQWIAPQFGTYKLEIWQVYQVAAAPELYVEVAVYFIGYTAIGAMLAMLAAELTELK